MVKLPLNTSLKEELLTLCQTAQTDEQLAQSIAGSHLLEVITSYGMCTNEQAATMLGYKSKRSVDSMAQKSAHFPQPKIHENLWSTQELLEYKEHRGRNTK
ncbi:hypothetical protein AB0O14_19000 [Microbacterium foliorum]|uniref:hypothetical protein n=1 Tax=Rothia terrae TaxID=396015 RepID=UPI003430B4E6